jgi:hypothetical protein
VGRRPAADVHDGAADVRVEADARRRYVHHSPLCAIVAGELSSNGRALEHDGRRDAHVVCALPSVLRRLAIGRGRAVGDGCALADDRCECSPPLSFPSDVPGNHVHDGCASAEGGCSGTDVGCPLAADVPDSAATVRDGSAAVRVKADACRRFVHHGQLFAFVTGGLSANNREPEHDG